MNNMSWMDRGSVWQVGMGTEKLKGCGDGEDVGRARSGSEGEEEGMTSDNASLVMQIQSRGVPEDYSWMVIIMIFIMA